MDISKEFKEFNCKDCTAKFKYARSLKYHVKIKHQVKIIDVTTNNIKNIKKSLDISKAFDCIYCKSSFKYDISLQRHMRKYHQDIVGSEIIQNVCNVCGKKSTSKPNLMRHIRTVHNYNNIFYQCNICSKKYASKDSLQQHQKKNHPDLHDEYQYQFIIKVENETDKAKNLDLIKCEVCERKFTTNRQIKRHMKHSHPEKVAPQSRTIKCCLEDCNESFVTLHQYRMHLMEQEAAGGHNYTIEKQELDFNNIGEFIQWKEDLEIANDSRYVTHWTPRKNKDGSYRRTYHCSRSGKYISEGTGKRSAKSHGTSKIGDYCPSTINIHCNSLGIVKCEYYETHFGHGTSWENIMQIPMHKRDRLFIAKKTLQGIEIKKILEELNKMGGRAALIKHRDIMNVLNSDILKDVASCINSRSLNVDEMELNKYKVSSKKGVSHEVTFLNYCSCSKQCLQCKVCEHSYICDCRAFNKLNICKHIHAVGGVNIVQPEQMHIDDIYSEEEIQMLNEDFIPYKEVREEKIEKVNTILNQIKGSLDKCSVEGINKMIPLIEKIDTLRCTFEMNGDSY